MERAGQQIVTDCLALRRRGNRREDFKGKPSISLRRLGTPVDREGRLGTIGQPAMLGQAGFMEVTESRHFATVFGTLALYQGRKQI